MRLTSLLLAGAISTVNAFAPNAYVRPSTSLNIAEGDDLPSVELFQEFPDVKKINIADYVKGKNVIILGLPGAFTPTWSSTQVPGYLEEQDALKEAGIEEVVVFCVNDSAVMQAWAEDQGIAGSFITMMGDPTREFTTALDVEMNDPGPASDGIINRSKRCAFHVVDGVVKAVRISEAPGDPAGDDDPSATLADAMLEVIKA